MAWDSSRPIPWNRLVKDWAIYAAIMCVIFVVAFRDRLSAGPFVGLAVSAPLYLAVGGFLAKLGYQRKSLKDLRAETAQRQAEREAETRAATPTGRARPAPTKRTSTGSSNRPNKPKRR